MSQTDFAYTQTRLQARHGERPDARLWHQLASAGDFSNYLQALRRSPLHTWVEGIQGDGDSHALEIGLRRQFRRYVSRTAHWLPAPWRATVRPIAHLPDLPAIQSLLRGERAPDWIHDDPVLGELIGADRQPVRDRLHLTGHDYLIDGRPVEQPLYLAWSKHWQSTWPRDTRLRAGFVELDTSVRRYLQAQHSAPPGEAKAAHEALEGRFTAIFRRHSFKPAAACAHLALVALDLMRLRGELVYRALFEDTPGATTA